ncbi:MAG: o-succinylbenzoate synthase, partial [Gemmatimonadetes bacterium]|nr:o-succinylbenzoate synthase [Gemmatimonadota bacterium]NIQ59908.1 o-succinylbenzoate synthase [Gemmatimonadota bacterium]NIU80108.1 o-succinylbenzoate synthase [Gammaproteobacteria bacterium]NIX48521.1 o-succinylbenzoate synthase [Gemmatimonadota bacterium]NIY12964.1 o-succinylbenzoate synthase [Gemmatimonadota bacterium]
RTSGGETHDRTVLLCHLEGEGVEGLGECVAGEAPHYSAETVETAVWVLERYLAPAVLGRDFGRAEELGPVLARAARGHPMAKAAIEMAAWDAEARSRGESLASLLGGAGASVPAGVSLGIRADTAELLDRIDGHVAEGYRRIKLKIEPGRDVAVLDAVRSRYPDVPLTVDANTAYTTDDMDLLVGMDRYGLEYVEQPFGADELVAHAALGERMTTPVCLDESIGSPGRCRDALALGACGVVNIKPGRVGGHGPARAIHDLCQEAGIPVWCGGMLESGVGRAHNVALASLPNMTLPGDVSASRRYWE